ncbi:MAG: N-acetyltransferase [Betaproteobacteria bacterium]|nr:N-acetyltransferase [Betaproteobacteria bacterium]
MREYELTIIETLAGIPAAEWNALAGPNPTLQWAFLQSMIDAGCTTPERGWRPLFLILRRDLAGQRAMTGALPLYLKGHSYGEYVFDWAWAEAYHQHGLDYYPKLVAAVPFTPCTGPRLMAATEADRAILLEGALSIAREEEVSSLHVLFPPEAEQARWVGAGLLQRHSVQFHWRNAGYPSFESFLSTMSHDKRKRIRQERRKVREAGLVFRRVSGADIREADWDFFAACYRKTYREHRSTPYLNRAFFGLIGERMPGNLMLVMAERDGQPVASALNLVGGGVMYGRYWGTTAMHSGLHFETCYYQAIEHAIELGLATIEGGAQGEHKLARGFEPVRCHSAHWLKHPQFARAVEDFLEREREGIARYESELEDSSPFRKSSTGAATGGKAP